MIQPAYLLIVLLAGVVGTVVAAVAWRNRDRPGAGPLALFVVAATVWAVVDGLHLAATGPSRLRFLQQVGLTLSAVIPVAWLWTALAFTGRRRWLRGRVAALLLVEPVVFAGLVWTNGAGGHEFVWAEAAVEAFGSTGSRVMTFDFGLAFWLHQGYSYVLVITGALVILSMVVRSRGVYRKPGTALLGAILLPMLGNALYVIEVAPGLNPTGLASVLAGLIIAGAIFRADLLAIAPVTRELGREVIISELEDAVFILDQEDRVVDVTTVAETLVERPTGDLRDLIGKPLGEVLPELASAPDASPDLPDELELERDGEHRFYDVRISEINEYGGVRGRLVSLRDVTERHQRKERIDVLNRLLRHNLRNEMNVVRGNVSLAIEQVGDPAVLDRLDRVVETVDTVIDRSNKVGTLTRTMEGHTDQPVDVARQIREELSACRGTYPEADLEAEVPETCWISAGPSMSVVWNELVTNAVLHNEGSPRVRIALDETETDDRYVALTVEDDGQGLDDQEWRAIAEGGETPLQHGSGFGLWMVNWIVRTYGGSVSFPDRDGGDTGLAIRVTLPRTSPPGETEEG
ncbi:MAG: histidine kinase N-terminal 7TM domain-containing protein [Haloarculaceae archaeon]